jgi:branched-chain amino acid transport system substrate-binding protein
MRKYKVQRAVVGQARGGFHARNRTAVRAGRVVAAAGLCGSIGFAQVIVSQPSSASVASVVIGAPLALTGGDAINGQNCLNGIKLAAQQINASGGIKALGGAKIKIVSADTSSDDPAQALSATQKVIQDHAVALVGTYDSQMTSAAGRAAQEAGVPILTQSLAATLTQAGNKDLFMISPNSTVQGQDLMRDLAVITKDQGVHLKSVALVGSDNAAGQEESTAAGAAAKIAGIPVSADVYYPVGLTDATSIVGKLQSAKPGAIIINGLLSDISVIMKQARSSGVTAVFVNPGGGGEPTPQFLTAVGQKIANGTLSIGAWNYDLNLPGVKAANAAYVKQYKAPYMPYEAGQSWVAVYDIVAAIQAAKSDTPATIRNTLATSVFKSGPASAMPPGKVAWTATGSSAYGTPVVTQWQSGVLRTVYPPSLATAKLLPNTFAGSAG